VVDAMVYMYFLGLGAAAGVGTVVFVAWKVYSRAKTGKKKNRKAVV